MKYFFRVTRFLVSNLALIAVVLMSCTNASADVISDPTEGWVCGGVAGVECPVGYTCEYFRTDSTDAQGVCKKINAPARPGSPDLSGPPPVPNPAGHPLGIHCPSGTTWVHGACVPISQPHGGYIGIPTTQMNAVVAAQRNSQWCWTAAIQMVLNDYGVHIVQEQIVS